jgi:ERCC4-type nuclease
MEIDRLSALTIIEDTREQTPLDFSAFPFVTVERGTLHSGDYSVKGYEERFAVERKSLADLIGTITHGHARFERELQRLMSFQYAAVVVEAPEMDLRTGKYRSLLLPRAAVGMITAFEVRYRIPFHFCGTRTMAAQRIYELAYYFQREMLKEVPPAPPAERVVAEKKVNARRRASRRTPGTSPDSAGAPHSTSPSAPPSAASSA